MTKESDPIAVLKDDPNWDRNWDRAMQAYGFVLTYGACRCDELYPGEPEPCLWCYCQEWNKHQNKLLEANLKLCERLAERGTFQELEKLR